MEQYIPVSLLNDFVYSPSSIYLHSIYQEFDQSIYKSRFQTNGTLNHTTIDNGKYSTSANTLQGTMFYCQKYGLCGRIDIFDIKKGLLIERKSCIKQLFPGYRFQLYAQMFGLIEQGHIVKQLCLHSLEDNKRYPISLPNELELAEFENLINQLKNFDPLDLLNQKHLDQNCQISIYNNLAF